MRRDKVVSKDEIKKRVPGARVYLRPESPLWQVQFTVDGRKVRRSSGTDDEHSAWLVLDRLYAALFEISFKAAAVEFFQIKSRTLKPTTLRAYQCALRSVDPIFGTLLLREITAEVIKNFVRARRSEVSDTTVKRELSFLSSVFTFAQVEMTGAPEVNPFKALSKRHLKEKPRDYYLSFEEYQRLLAQCRRPYQKVVIQTAARTGMRHAEIRMFRKAWVNWNQGGYGEIQLPREYTKSGRPRIIPILPDYVDTLRDWIENEAHSDSEFVFTHGDPPNQFTSFQGFFKVARKNAGLEGMRFHDLRHTFASWWVQSGGSLLVLKDILGHADLQMVQRYAHLDTAAAHREVTRLAGHTQGHNTPDTQRNDDIKD